MKKLIISRHGKSSWELNVRDHDRVLNQRGIDDGHLVGKHLKEMNIKPDLIWSSTAARALQTATIVTEYIDYSLSKLRLNRNLYTFSSDELKRVIQSCTDDVDTLMIFSHNHGITDFVNRYGNKAFDNVPTTGVVQLIFDTNQWSDITRGSTQFYVFPKHIR
ncbi:histidine phosphatase family protein [Nonlabens spongiae]|uniref:Histidine phosphatase family protein n=1 Tax=Nonlabens spongiae TaxID=331648 RepID=A0A1W6MP30_9FLAO|nr:histidine phosphatase family protein [Nonlabens spongiae]ARN79345.1 histidine phosphatase family protein [Nonlabens spongiae]